MNYFLKANRKVESNSSNGFFFVSVFQIVVARRPAAFHTLGRRAPRLRSPVADADVVDVVVVVGRRREQVGATPLLALVVEKPGQQVSGIDIK